MAESAPHRIVTETTDRNEVPAAETVDGGLRPDDTQSAKADSVLELFSKRTSWIWGFLTIAAGLLMVGVWAQRQAARLVTSEEFAAANRSRDQSIEKIKDDVSALKSERSAMQTDINWLKTNGLTVDQKLDRLLEAGGLVSPSSTGKHRR